MKKLKKILSFALAIVCCFSMSTAALAAEPSYNEDVSVISDETIQPRVGHAGYASHYHSGGTEASVFYVTTKKIAFPLKQFTIQSSGFNESTVFKLFIYNSSNQLVSLFTGEGNATWPNRNMSNFVDGDTYTVIYGVEHPSDDGWINMWIY